MARAKRKMNTFSILIIFLLSIGVFVTTTLYFDVRHKNTLLLSEVERLQSSQVLLMVPDEQAEVVAKWMAEHPKATQALLSHAKPQQEVKVTVGPGVEVSEARVHKTSQGESRNAAQLGQDDIVVPSSIARTPNQKIDGDSVNEATDLSRHSSQTPSNTQEAELASTLESGGIKSEVDGSGVQKELVAVPLTISENEDGVKVISLPHGGIRVTTRENN
ncbi:conserved hypothetical protein [Shewanella sediminis HAW-EB3]|uniref:Membrane anchored protein in chemotaxis locus n=1 Tax=Shewanella sediminis (strain HAW-EB3) TaxID=425104 RepID=A8FXS5_SHESH|nr:hypothetical protein [Shewanella sediminis]ABV37648.1 conserved hypothetical protein [Shewanella sediminis HAW-EB3]